MKLFTKIAAGVLLGFRALRASAGTLDISVDGALSFQGTADKIVDFDLANSEEVDVGIAVDCAPASDGSEPTAEIDGPGVYPITVRVTDDGPGALDHTQSFTITVDEEVARWARIEAARRSQTARSRMRKSAARSMTLTPSSAPMVFSDYAASPQTRAAN